MSQSEKKLIRLVMADRAHVRLRRLRLVDDRRRPTSACLIPLDVAIEALENFIRSK